MEAKIQENNLKDDAHRMYKKSCRAEEKLDKISTGIRKCLDRAEKYPSKLESMANIRELYQRLEIINDLIRQCSTTNDNAFDVSVI